MKLSNRLRASVAGIMLGCASSAAALDTASIAASALSPDCLEYRVVGICYWLRCGFFGCSVRTSVKIRHYVPDAVVSSYSNTGANPWIELRLLSIANPTAVSGGDGTTNQPNENNLQKYKNADLIGHPAGAAFSGFAGAFGYTCEGAGKPLIPYFLSTLDTVAWRYNLPESVYPEALIPGRREIGARTSMNLWGNVYPRGGFQHQADDYKGGAVVAQRTGDIVTRHGQPHVYQPLLANSRDGYWPAGELVEGDASTGKWQELTPTLTNSCAVFPNTNSRVQAKQGDFAWALWRPYSCCQRRGQVFLGSMNFD